ncbi:MAG: hypothetical protein EU547_01195 [Promethearchaeota archaeon]|nr:MAG: hypothetical protein EU547_01195 [Candidatus Lokiarchaeota archaeon]
MVHEENTKVNIKLDKDLIFTSLLNTKKIPKIFIDESLEKSDPPIGPDAATLLGMGVTSCLCASFIFCLQKRNLTLDDLEANAEISFYTTKQGYMRVKQMDIKLIPKSEDSEVLKRIKQCTREMRDGDMMFEKTCIITPSVREGFDINVDVKL